MPSNSSTMSLTDSSLPSFRVELTGTPSLNSMPSSSVAARRNSSICPRSKSASLVLISAGVAPISARLVLRSSMSRFCCALSSFNAALAWSNADLISLAVSLPVSPALPRSDAMSLLSSFACASVTLFSFCAPLTASRRDFFCLATCACVCVAAVSAASLICFFSWSNMLPILSAVVSATSPCLVNVAMVLPSTVFAAA